MGSVRHHSRPYLPGSTWNDARLLPYTRRCCILFWWWHFCCGGRCRAARAARLPITRILRIHVPFLQRLCLPAGIPSCRALRLHLSRTLCTPPLRTPATRLPPGVTAVPHSLLYLSFSFCCIKHTFTLHSGSFSNDLLLGWTSDPSPALQTTTLTYHTTWWDS